MVIDITPLVGAFFNMILALIGIDFLCGGFWYMKTREIKRIKGLSYLMLKLFERFNRKNKSSNQFAKRMFSMDAVGIYMIVAGIGYVIQGLFPLLTQLYR